MSDVHGRSFDVTFMVAPSPEQLAKSLGAMDSSEQARFFNALEVTIGGGGWAFQLQAVTDDPGLTPAGRRIMSYIGDYAEQS